MATAALPCLGQGRSDFLGGLVVVVVDFKIVVVVVVVVEPGFVVVVAVVVVVVASDKATVGATKNIETTTSPTRDAAGNGARRSHLRGDEFTNRFYAAHRLNWPAPFEIGTRDRGGGLSDHTTFGLSVGRPSPLRPESKWWSHYKTDDVNGLCASAEEQSDSGHSDAGFEQTRW